MKMKKKLCLVLALVLALCIVPWNFETFGAGNIHISSNADFDNAKAAGKLNGSTVVLDKDIAFTKEYEFNNNISFTIDLNGHSLLAAGNGGDCFITLKDNASLTITDNSANADGYIQSTGGRHEGLFQLYHKSKLTLEDGELRGNDDDDCGLIFVDDGTFVMNGGSLTNNVYDSYGSAVCIDEGSFYMYGGEIYGNKGDDDGTIYFDGSTSSTFLMAGGEIHDNEAAYGGAIYFDDWKGTISGGKIYNNTARMGGGIYIDSTCDGLELSGDLEITGNKATYYTAGGHDTVAGGGVHFEIMDLFCDYAVTFGGSVKIYGNDPTDCYVINDYETVKFKSDLDTSPMNHAWIGMAGNWSPVHRNLEVKPGNRDYTVCFFGREVPHAAYEIVIHSYDNGTPVFMVATLDNIMDINGMTSMDFNENGMRDNNGKMLIVGEDYTYTFDDLMLVYTVNSEKGLIIDDMTHLLSTDREAFVDATIVRHDIEMSEDATTHTLVYLCRNELTRNKNKYYRDVYYTVILNIANHTVDFDMGGHGTQIKSQKVEDDTRAFQPEDPEEDGLMFKGWYADSDYQTPFNFNDPITQDTTVYARWGSETDPDVCEVHFDMGGHGTQVPYQNVSWGEKATEPEDPSETGWIFGGWYTDDTFETTFDFTEPITADVTVYAKWTKAEPEVTYTVSFDMGGHGEQIGYQVVKSGNKAAEPEEPAEEGWVFIDWYKDAEFRHEFDFDFEITADTVIYAKWKANKEEPLIVTHTLTFEMNGHGNQVPYQTLGEYDVTVKPEEPDGGEWDFDDWYTDDSFETPFIFGNTISEDTTVYAQWAQLAPPPIAEPITVNFDMNGHGEQVPYQAIAKYSFVTEPEDPEEDGWIFGGWYKEKTTENEFDFDLTVDDNTTIYAKWTAKPYDVTFDLNYEGAPAPEVKKQTNGKKYDLPEDPVRAGYIFDGWFTDEDPGIHVTKDTIVALTEDETLYAHWTAKKAPEFIPPEPREDLSYTGEELILALRGRTSDGTLKYVVDESSSDPKDGWNDTIDRKTDAGIYYVHYFVEGDEEHLDSEVETFTVTIAKGSWRFDQPEANELTFTGEAQELVSAGNVPGGVMQYSLNEDGPFTTDIPKGTEAGEYSVYFMIEGDKNHTEYTGEDPIVVTINEKPEDPDDPDTPQTGDRNHLILYGIIAVIALAGAGVTIALISKKRK